MRDRPHRRLNPLTGEWVLVSPHRADRPWLGERVAAPQPNVPAYDPQCYLCPGNERAGGVRNPRYESVYAFDNDYPALLTEGDTHDADAGRNDRGLFVEKPEGGVCRVMCFSPRHDLHLASMTPAQVRTVVDTWALQYNELSALPLVEAVTIFENRGAAMGASNPHPHCQIWAETSVPNELQKESREQERHAIERAHCLLCEYARAETEQRERVVVENEALVAVVPFWAVWPFEVLVVPRRHCGTLPELDDGERDALAATMRMLLAQYDGLFSVPFPYSMGWHQRPSASPGTSGGGDSFHMHAHYYPPLLRSATVRKYMVGYEMLAQPQRDLTPEAAAAALRQGA